MLKQKMPFFKKWPNGLAFGNSEQKFEKSKRYFCLFGTKRKCEDKIGKNRSEGKMNEIIFKCAICSDEIKRMTQLSQFDLVYEPNISCPRCNLTSAPTPPAPAAAAPPAKISQLLNPPQQKPFDISAAVANIQLPPLSAVLNPQPQPQPQTIQLSQAQPQPTVTTLRLSGNTVLGALSSPPPSHVQLPINPLPQHQVVTTVSLPQEPLPPPIITTQLQATLPPPPPLPPAQIIQIKTPKPSRPPPEVFMSLNPVAVTNQIHPNMLHQQQQQVQNPKKNKKGGPRKQRQSHSGKEKKFSCQFCDFRSSTNYNVSAHVKSVHCKIKDFQCDMCDFKSSKKWNLKSHIKTVHDKVKDYHCNLCDYKSSRRDALIKHYGDVHQKMK